VHGDDRSHTVIPIHDQSCTAILDNSDVGSRVDKAATEAFGVDRNASDAVRIDAPQVSVNKAAGNRFRIAQGQAVSAQDLSAELLESIRGADEVCHCSTFPLNAHRQPRMILTRSLMVAARGFTAILPEVKPSSAISGRIASVTP